MADATPRTPISDAEKWLSLIYGSIGGGGSIASGLEDIAVEIARTKGFDYEGLNGLKFYYITSPTIDLKSLDTSGFTDMYGMFQHCDGITELDMKHFDTSNVTNMSYMFYFCNHLTTLDLSSFNFSNVTNITRMFERCFALTSINLQSVTTNSMTSSSNMISLSSNVHDIIWAIDSPNVQALPSANSFDKATDTVPSDLNIWVRDALLDDYKLATNMARYADCYKPISELPQSLQTLYNIDPSDFVD